MIRLVKYLRQILFVNFATPILNMLVRNSNITRHVTYSKKLMQRLLANIIFSLWLLQNERNSLFKLRLAVKKAR